MNLGFKKMPCPEVNYLKGNRVKHNYCLLSKLLLSRKQNFFQNYTLGLSVFFFFFWGGVLFKNNSCHYYFSLFLFVKIKP